MTTVRRCTRSAAIALLAVVATACPEDPPAPPTGPSPSAATVTAITPGGSSFSNRPMSADGRYVGYNRVMPGFEPNMSYSTPYLWDRVTDDSVALSDERLFGPEAVAPVISSDGSTAWFGSLAADTIYTGGEAINRYDIGSGDIDVFPFPDGDPYGDHVARRIATSADGTVVAVEVGNGTPFAQSDVALWTEAGGFDVITDASAISAGTVYGYGLPGSAVSENGRYVAVVTLVKDSPTTRHSRLDVYDRTDESWRTAWTGTVTSDPQTYFENVTVLATLPDGSLIYDVSTGYIPSLAESIGVRLWDASTGTTTLLTTKDTTAQGVSASPDGRFIGYTGSDRPGTPAFDYGTPHLLDRQTGTILPAGKRPVTLPVAIANGGQDVLLLAFQSDLDVDTTDGNALFLWHRS